MMFTSKCGSDASAALLTMAGQCAATNAPLSRELYLEAMSTVLFAGRLADGGGAVDVARAAAAAPASRLSAEPPPDLLLDGLTAVILDGSDAGIGLLHKALNGFCCADESGLVEGTRWLWLACHAAIIAWDDRSWQLLPHRQVALARAADDRRVLAVALHSLAAALVWQGDFGRAGQLITEAEAIGASIGAAVFPYAALPLAAWKGDQVETQRLATTGRHVAIARGEGMGLASIELATAVLCNGLGSYEQALAAARDGAEHQDELWATFFLPELIEAATRCGQTSEAVAALELLERGARAAGTDWALGAHACSRALVSDGESAEHLYRAAIDHLGKTGLRPVEARAQLVYGEWLRRQRRPLDARAHLRRAYDTFTAIGMTAFAQRARLELASAGSPLREIHSLRVDSVLTAREQQISALAASGATNAEIGAQLFISPNTVAYHLRKVYTKLGVTTRRQLAMNSVRQPRS